MAHSLCHLIDPGGACASLSIWLEQADTLCLGAGITKATNTVEDATGMVRLWTHEALRVFHDRLTDDHDRVWFGKLLCELLETHFKEKPSKLLGVDPGSDSSLVVGMRSLLFGDFMVPGADPKLYKCAAAP